MERSRGFVVRAKENFCFIRSKDEALAREFYAHMSDSEDREIPPVETEAEFTPTMPRGKVAEYSAEFCKVLEPAKK